MRDEDTKVKGEGKVIGIETFSGRTQGLGKARSFRWDKTENNFIGDTRYMRNPENIEPFSEGLFLEEEHNYSLSIVIAGDNKFRDFTKGNSYIGPPTNFRTAKSSPDDPKDIRYESGEGSSTGGDTATTTGYDF